MMDAARDARLLANKRRFDAQRRKDAIIRKMIANSNAMHKVAKAR